MSQFMLDFSEEPVPRRRRGALSRRRYRWLGRTGLPVLATVLVAFFYYSREIRQLRQRYNAQVLRHDSLLGAHLDAQRRLYRLQHELERLRFPPHNTPPDTVAPRPLP